MTYKLGETEWANLTRHSDWVYWAVGLPACLVVVSALLRMAGMNGRLKGPKGKDGKPKGEGSKEADVMSYELVVLGLLCHFSYHGVHLWFLHSEQLPTDSVHGRSDYIERHILVPMTIYQFWNFFICLFLKEFSDWESLIHHILTTAVSFFGMGPIFQYYGAFFCGCTELSTVPLTAVDIFKKFPRFRDQFATLNSVSRITFAASFLFLRVAYWPVIAVFFWKDAFALLQSGEQKSTFVVLLFLVSNMGLTLLQFMWGKKILGFLVSTVNPPATDGKKAK
mmetsp:Transcript_23451/g.46221  ORF Transcript_23451/g.46221 Transcript_23451/m.46221 type:complete len:280 (-) Transcript_23451:114-953(-)|eukprot:CAMPEP_0175145574 /NCGR_PEP_ID=MMETSP0087-20121206/14854_1 /TAXON_ID=136419 /ORGANISM="Unknown Unknown, Strain D1" /LENGTH=279 /DNA_ID=CAMNT_0016430351 /DNA_START=25 /DNA_END=864 /DNA_ORIENTATION=+